MAAYGCIWLHTLVQAACSAGGVAATKDVDQYVYFTVWPQTHVSA